MIEYHACPGCGNKTIHPSLSARDYTTSGEEFEIWECSNCTLRFTQQAPGKEDIGRYYQSEAYISHSDTSAGLVNKLYHEVRKRTLLTKKKLVRRVTGKNLGKILDIGCGTAAFLNTMKNAGWDSTGIEPDPTARAKAFELYGLKPEEEEKLYRLPEHSFDAITMWHVLEHVHDLHLYMDQLKKLAAPGGRILIAVPNYTSYDARIYQQFWAAYDVPRHLYHFSPKAMEIILATHGLKIEAMRPMWYDSIYVSMLSEKYKTGKAHPLKALGNGCLSNLHTIFHRQRCSSLIYIVTLS